ncbi:GNAT family N-acetyltransferase [Maribacter sp. 2304DJ31-5]|uniref:GNAT family N-acetyltransferase n=1 Tax=Maribacter sp. 2304DJ31-5 TaxID=3386273 RepID=UPI0039BD3582
MDLEFKKCRLHDIPKLTKIAKRTFRAAFEQGNDPKDFKIYMDGAFTKNKMTTELINPDTYFYFVYKDRKLIGYFKLNQNLAQTDLKLPESMELERLYILVEFQDAGLGTIILHKVKEMAYKKDKDFLWLGVWEKNKDAIRFYIKNGFVKFGTHPYFIGTDEQTDWLMRYDLVNFNHQ